MGLAGCVWFVPTSQSLTERFKRRLDADKGSRTPVVVVRQVESSGGSQWREWIKDDCQELLTRLNEVAAVEAVLDFTGVPWTFVADLSMEPGGKALRETVFATAEFLARLRSQQVLSIARDLFLQVVLLLPNRILSEPELAELGVLLRELHWFLRGSRFDGAPETIAKSAGCLRRLVLFAPSNRDPQENPKGFVAGDLDAAIAEVLYALCIPKALAELENGLAPDQKTGVLALGAATIFHDADGAIKTLAAHRLAEVFRTYLGPLMERPGGNVLAPIQGIVAASIIRDSLVSGSAVPGAVRFESLLSGLRIREDGLSPPKNGSFLDWSRGVPWLVRVRERVLWVGPFSEVQHWARQVAREMGRRCTQAVSDFIDQTLGAVGPQPAGDVSGKRWAIARAAADELRLFLESQIEEAKHAAPMTTVNNSDPLEKALDILRDLSGKESIAREVEGFDEPEPFYQELEKLVRNQPLAEAAKFRATLLGVLLAMLAATGTHFASANWLTSFGVGYGVFVLSLISGLGYIRTYRRRVVDALVRVKCVIVNKLRSAARDLIRKEVLGILGSLREMVPTDEEPRASEPGTETWRLNSFRKRLVKLSDDLSRARYTAIPEGVESPFFVVVPVAETIGFGAKGQDFESQREQALEDLLKRGAFNPWRKLVNNDIDEQKWLEGCLAPFVEKYKYLMELPLTELPLPSADDLSRAFYPFSGLDSALVKYRLKRVVVVGDRDDAKPLKGHFNMSEAAVVQMGRRNQATIVCGAMGLKLSDFPLFLSAADTAAKLLATDYAQAENMHTLPEFAKIEVVPDQDPRWPSEMAQEQDEQGL